MAKVVFENTSFKIDNEYVIRSFSDPMKKAFPEIAKGAPCYKALKGASSPCADCPIFSGKSDSEMYYTDFLTNNDYFALFANAALDDGTDGYSVTLHPAGKTISRFRDEIDSMQHKIDIYRQANYNCAYAYFECNLSKDVIVTEITEVVDNEETVVNLESKGLKKPITLTAYRNWFLDRKVGSYRQEFEEMMNSENLIKKFNAGEKEFTLTFKSRSTSGYFTYQQQSIYIYKAQRNDDIMALFVLRDIYHKILEEQSSRRNEEIMHALADEYTTVFYIDLDTLNVSCINLPHYAKELFSDAIKEKKYPELTDLYIKSRILNSDAKTIEKTVDIDSIKKVLSEKKSFSMIYRVGTETDFKYFEFKAARTEEEGEVKSIVIGIADKDDMIRAQLTQARELEQALVLAQKDSLTNIRNRTAYDLAEHQLDADVESGKIREFAIVMFDVNRLKITNDTYGHEKGNLLLINSSKLICDIFKHSPTFRIGGDEFVAILTGEDYQNRDELLEAFRQKIRSNEEIGEPIYKNVSLACGMAVFDPDADRGASEVLERADRIMYANKAEMKARKRIRH